MTRTSLFLLLFLPSLALAQTGGDVITIAGGGDQTGEDIPARDLDLAQPVHAIASADGTLYITETLNHRILIVDPASGLASTLAGTGIADYSGDDGPATEAELRRPQGLSLDEDAALLYIADTGNHVVRAVDLVTGTITTVTGTGVAGFDGDGGPAADAVFDEIVDVLFDGFGLFIADGIDVTGTGNNRVRFLDLATDTVQTYAGNGIVLFSGDGGAATEAGVSPEGLALDTNGNLFIADAVNHRIRRVSAVDSTITTVAGQGGDFFGFGGFGGDGGPATDAKFDNPAGVAVGPDGTIYIADTANNRIRAVDPVSGTVVSIVAQAVLSEDSDTTFAFQTPLFQPIRLQLDAEGGLIVADVGRGRIRRMADPSFRAPFVVSGPDALDYGSVTLGDPTSLSFELRNEGSDTLSVMSLEIDETSFTLDDTGPFAIPPAGFRIVQVTSEPELQGLLEGILTVTTNDLVSPRIEVPLSALAVVPQIGVLPESLLFDRTFVGSEQTFTVRVSNLSQGVLLLREALVSDPQFVTDFTDTLRILSGQNITLSVTFRPALEDTQRAELQLITNDLDDSPFIITLQGTGQIRKAGGFVDVADSLGISDPNAGFGVAWADYDADGDPDIYLVRSLEPNRLYRNDGGEFTEVAGSLGVDDDGDGSGAAWADIDGDGDLDLYVTNFGGPNRLFRNDGSTFAEVGAAWGVDDSGDGYGTAIADYDRDGDADIYVANFGSNRLFRNDGNRFVEVAGLLGVDDDDSGVQPSWADVDNDGDPDLFVANSGSNRFYTNNGDGTFTDATEFSGLQDSGPSFGSAWGDFDNDGDLDLYVTYFAEANRLYQNNNGRFQNVASARGTAHPGRGRGAVWGDFDNDGDLDLYVTNSGEPNVFYRNEGFSFVDVADTLGVALDADSRGVALGDMDLDGGLDLFVAVQNGPDRLFRNQEANGNWFLVRTSGTQSSFDAIGTRLELVTPLGTTIREISGGASFLSQDALSASFGIGRAESIDVLTVRWPLGIVQRFVDLPVNTIFDLEEAVPPPPIRVELEANTATVVANGQAEVSLLASILNENSEVVLGTSLSVVFRIVQGDGMFVGSDTVTSVDGLASAVYRAGMDAGTVEISASVEGLLQDSVFIELLEPLDSDRLTIRTVAGSGTGFSGDDGLATEALLRLPRMAVINGAGDLYVADTSNNRLRFVDAVTQIITTIAGDGVAASSGTDGPAVLARVADPRGMAVMPNGDILVSEQGGHTVRRIVVATDTIVAFAGRGIPGFGGDTRSARDANLTSPHGLAVDPDGNVWIADQFNQRIRKVDTDGIITTVAGTGLAGSAGDGGPATKASLNRPLAVAVDSLGTLYIADAGNHRIRRVDSAGTITTLAGDGSIGFFGDGGPATRARLNQPTGIALDRSGNLYIADTGNDRIRLVDLNTRLIQTVAGTGTAQPTQEEGLALLTTLDNPSGLFLTPTGTVLIADAGNGRIRDLSVVLNPGSSGPLMGRDPSDFDDDGSVQFSDFLLFAQAFGTQEPRFDLDGNGSVGFSDFLRFIDAFQVSAPALSRPALRWR